MESYKMMMNGQIMKSSYSKNAKKLIFTTTRQDLQAPQTEMYKITSTYSIYAPTVNNNSLHIYGDIFV